MGITNWTHQAIRNARGGHAIGCGVVGEGGMVRDRENKTYIVFKYTIFTF